MSISLIVVIMPDWCNSGITGNELREIVAVAAKLRNVLFLV